MGSIIAILGYIFVVFGLLILFAAKSPRGWNLGLLLGGLCFMVGGFATGAMGSIWPLIVAFLLAWILRLMGADPGYRR